MMWCSKVTAVFVALHDHQLAPPPRQVHAKRELVAPGANAMDDAVLARAVLHQLIDGGEDGIVEEIGVVAVVLLLPLHRLALGRELLRRNVPEGLHPGQPPLGERLVDHGGG